MHEDDKASYFQALDDLWNYDRDHPRFFEEWRKLRDTSNPLGDPLDPPGGES